MPLEILCRERTGSTVNASWHAGDACQKARQPGEYQTVTIYVPKRRTSFTWFT